MSHYCGIDLHSNNHVVVVIDERDKRVFDKRLNNDLSSTLQVLSPYRETLKGIVTIYSDWTSRSTIVVDVSPKP